MSFDRKQAMFLDVEVEVTHDGILVSNLYRIPTAGNTVLRADSFQPKQFIKSIPYSQ